MIETESTLSTFILKSFYFAHYNVGIFLKMFIQYVFERLESVVSSKKGALRNFAKFTGKHLCQSLLFNKVFSCEFCEISKNTFFTEHLRVTASGNQAKP